MTHNNPKLLADRALFYSTFIIILYLYYSR